MIKLDHWQLHASICPKLPTKSDIVPMKSGLGASTPDLALTPSPPLPQPSFATRFGEGRGGRREREGSKKSARRSNAVSGEGGVNILTPSPPPKPRLTFIQSCRKTRLMPQTQNPRAQILEPYEPQKTPNTNTETPKHRNTETPKPSQTPNPKPANKFCSELQTRFGREDQLFDPLSPPSPPPLPQTTFGAPSAGAPKRLFTPLLLRFPHSLDK